MQTHYTHNDFHLGDNLVFLNYLRRLALANPGHGFVHAAHECHLAALAPVVQDVPNVALIRYEDRDAASIDVWKNAGAGTPNGGFWETHELKTDFAWFHVAWFTHLSRRMGLECPIRKPQDLLFDYPALLQGPGLANAAAITFDFLVINSRPCSGQCLAYDKVEYFDGLLAELAAKGYKVACTQKSEVPGVYCTADDNLSVTEIGHMSIYASHIVGVATGPMWPTFNVWNQSSVKTRIFMLEGEKLNLGTNCEQVANMDEIRALLVGKGLL